MCWGGYLLPETVLLLCASPLGRHQSCSVAAKRLGHRAKGTSGPSEECRCCFKAFPSNVLSERHCCIGNCNILSMRKESLSISFCFFKTLSNIKILFEKCTDSCSCLLSSDQIGLRLKYMFIYLGSIMGGGHIQSIFLLWFVACRMAGNKNYTITDFLPSLIFENLLI